MTQLLRLITYQQRHVDNNIAGNKNTKRAIGIKTEESEDKGIFHVRK